MGNKIYHIYYGTQGTAGLYLDEIYQSLCKQGFIQKIFVSSYYPFNYGNKVFFKYSDISHGVKNQRIRLLVRYIELIVAMIRLFFKTIMERPTIINYSLLSKLYLPEKLYLKSVRFLGLSKIMFTCHDVLPFGKIDEKILKERKNILNLADFYLVHNTYSKNELIKSFQIPIRKIKYHSFPIMDLNKLEYQLNKEKKFDFLYQGVLRREKGIEVLLDAWMKFHLEYPQARLLVAGLFTKKSIDISKYKDVNITFDFKYLSDFEYCQNIACSKCMILPYFRGTNSGIPSSSLSLGVEVITSDIPMFKDNDLIMKDKLFNSEDPDALYYVLKVFYEDSSTIVSPMERIISYRKNFNREVYDVYDSLLKKQNGI